MSQNGPVSRHATHRSSRSPVGDDQISPSSTRFGIGGGGDLRQEASGVPHTNGDARTQQQAPRTLGVHNILNPPEPTRLGHQSLTPASRVFETEVLGSSTPGSTHGLYAHSRPMPAGQISSMSLPGTPVGAPSSLGGVSSERNSPTMAFPFPAINNPRRILSPTGPRTSSLSHGPSREADPRVGPPLPSMSPAKRRFEDEAHDEPRTQLPGGQHPSGMPPGSMMTAARSLSQPVVPTPVSHAGLPNIPSSYAAGRTPTPAAPQNAPFPLSIPPDRSFSSSGPPPESGAPWSEMLRRHGGGMIGGEGQQAFMNLPGSEPIPVKVDFSQASKKADEKRQRNAVASTRHRRKKKIMQEENTKQLQDLREERQRLEHQLDKLIQERDFYRDDRNRLREIVSQTPSISGLAAGPPSPASARSSSYAERSPMVSIPQPGLAPQPYTGEPPPAERPAQRRRTEDRPEFSMPVYGPTSGGAASSASPTGLPSLPGQSFGGPSRPTSASSSGAGERLPPLRSMEGPPPPGPGAGPSHFHEQDPRTGQWVTGQHRQQEMGWATRRPEGPMR